MIMDFLDLARERYSCRYFDTEKQIEQEKIEHITNDENEIMKMLDIIKQNEVTPIALEDVILEIKSWQAIAKNKKLSYNT